MATSTAPARPTRTGPPSIVLKTVMAGTGLFLVLYVLVHMLGNLQILLGREAFDDYAHHLRIFGAPMLPDMVFLWAFRLLLLAAFVAHVWAAVVLWRRAGRARSTKYASRKATYGNFYAPAMRWGGVAIALFVIFHILHFTTQTITPAGAYDSPAERVMSSFQLWWVVLIYAAAMVALGLHLLHGIWGAAMTLGLNTSLKRAQQIRVVSGVLTAIIIVGFLVPPSAILLGIID